MTPHLFVGLKILNYSLSIVHYSSLLHHLSTIGDIYSPLWLVDLLTTGIVDGRVAVIVVCDGSDSSDYGADVI